MPSNTSKHLINNSLVETLHRMLTYLESVVSESDCEPASKRQKVERVPEQSDKYSRAQRTTKMLQKRGALAVGMKETGRALTEKAGKDDQNTKIFVLHDRDHQQSSSQLMATCR
jgi:hypothetical protein